MKNQQDSIESFYRFHDQLKTPARCQVHRREDFFCDRELPSKRRHFYKISWVSAGEGLLFYGDQCFTLSAGMLVLLNPNTPYSWIAQTRVQKGYLCAFEAEFLANNRHKNLLLAAPFRAASNPVYSLAPAQCSLITFLFEQMLAEQCSNYRDSAASLQNYVELIVHEVLKASPSVTLQPASSLPAAQRLAELFIGLLERQYSDEHTLHTPGDYAGRLAVHVNHLNRWVKSVTGKTTQQHINDRKVVEAKSQLRQTHASISEIAYSLGFNHPSNFNHFFKKQVGISPKAFRTHYLSCAPVV